MEEIISKRYAREAKTNSPDGWNIMVFITHISPENWVIFDCSTELNGRLINKELFPGPGLANKLVGVLTKFRENQVASMADIAKMYFQIFVAEQHRSLLWFLWWKEGIGISQRSQLIMRCVSMYLKVFHLEPAATTLWKLQQLRARRNLLKKLLKLCEATSMWMTCYGQWQMKTLQFS